MASFRKSCSWFPVAVAPFIFGSTISVPAIFFSLDKYFSGTIPVSSICLANNSFDNSWFSLYSAIAISLTASFVNLSTWYSDILCASNAVLPPKPNTLPCSPLSILSLL